VNVLAAGPTPAPVPRPRGVVLTAAQRHRLAEAPEPLPGKATSRGEVKVSLVDQFPPVRDQGERGTCVAFATAALPEYHLSDASPKGQRHSEQFLYWACKEDDGLPDKEGTHVSTAREVLRQRGACFSRTWKYQRLPIGPTEGQGPPPARALEEAPRFLKAD